MNIGSNTDFGPGTFTYFYCHLHPRRLRLGDVGAGRSHSFPSFRRPHPFEPSCMTRTLRPSSSNMVLIKFGVTLGSVQSQLYIGNSPSVSAFLAGVMDNVFVFADILSDQQIVYILQGGAQAIMTAARKIDPGILFLLLD